MRIDICCVWCLDSELKQYMVWLIRILLTNAELNKEVKFHEKRLLDHPVPSFT